MFSGTKNAKEPMQKYAFFGKARGIDEKNVFLPQLKPL
jgi:hypothetical protein